VLILKEKEPFPFFRAHFSGYHVHETVYMIFRGIVYLRVGFPSGLSIITGNLLLEEKKKVFERKIDCRSQKEQLRRKMCWAIVGKEGNV